MTKKQKLTGTIQAFAQRSVNALRFTLALLQVIAIIGIFVMLVSNMQDAIHLYHSGFWPASQPIDYTTNPPWYYAAARAKGWAFCALAAMSVALLRRILFGGETKLSDDLDLWKVSGEHKRVDVAI